MKILRVGRILVDKDGHRSISGFLLDMEGASNLSGKDLKEIIKMAQEAGTYEREVDHDNTSSI